MAEIEVIKLLEARGYAVTDLNTLISNHPVYDLIAERDGREIKINVKCARAKRDLPLGTPGKVMRMEAGSFFIALFPSAKGKEIDIERQDYEVWIIPEIAVRQDALPMHDLYWSVSDDPKAAMKYTVRVKDKEVREDRRDKSGAVFALWSNKYKDAWHLLD